MKELETHKLFVFGERVATPNDPKLSDRGVRRGTCVAGGKAAAEAGAVTHGAVRCSAWLGDVRLCLRDIRLGEVSARTLVNVGNLNVIVLLAVLHNKGKHRLATLNAQRRRVEHTPVCDEGDG